MALLDESWRTNDLRRAAVRLLASAAAAIKFCKFVVGEGRLGTGEEARTHVRATAMLRTRPLRTHRPFAHPRCCHTCNRARQAPAEKEAIFGNFRRGGHVVVAGRGGSSARQDCIVAWQAACRDQGCKSAGSACSISFRKRIAAESTVTALSGALAAAQQELATVKNMLNSLQSYCVGLLASVQGDMRRLSAVTAGVMQRASAETAKARKLAASSAKYEQVVRDAEYYRTKYMEEGKLRRAAQDALSEVQGNIRVFTRIRPILPHDKLAHDGGERVILASDGGDCVVVSQPGRPTKSFSFDRVFAASDTQASIMSEVAPLVTSLLDGYNGCVAAYGQTGAGKTHTMIGEGTGENRGLVLRAADELFRQIHTKRVERVCAVDVCLFEVCAS